ncbi:MAG: hypothetical protein H6751_09540 [Candidatus Omnitrophica bacterium]|nr:hypothetical protein [Candidatus Omnitrophota bacterium]
MVFGRIPCQTVTHLEGYLAKRRAYDRNSDEGWTDRLLWISDDNDPVERDTQDILGRTLPLAYQIEPIFIHNYPYIDNYYYGENLARIQEMARTESQPLDFGKISPAANQAILDELTQGAALAVYYGHSGLNVLAHERILFGGGSKHSDIPKINNEGRTPLLFLMTCDVGRFDFTDDRLWKWSYGLAEELLMHPFGGSLALVTSTGRGVPSDHKNFVSSCLESLLYRGATHAGSMLWAGKVGCLMETRPNDAVDMFTLLGDPLFEPPMPTTGNLLEPDRLKWSPDGRLEVEAKVEDIVESVASLHWIDPNDLTEHKVVDWELDETEGIVRFVVPQAYELEKLWVAYACQSKDEVKIEGGFAIDLAPIGRPDWKEFDPEEKPNLTLDSEDLIFENYSPTSGETQFVRARVHNRGEGVAWDVKVRGHEEGSDEPIMNIADSFPEPIIDRIGPGETKEIRLRWDHWAEVGLKTLIVEVDPDNEIEETNEEDNSASKTIKILDKADLAWGFVRDSTAGAVSFEQSRAVPNDWILNPQSADLGPWAPLRTYLNEVDRGAMILIPLTNFGEVPSATCMVEITYFKKGQKEPFRAPIDFRIGPVEPAGETASGKKFPVLLLPDLDRVKIEIDTGKELREQTRENNVIQFKVPSYFWEDIPVQREKREIPEAIRRIQSGR